MPTDPWSGSRYPASTAAPNVSQDIQNAVNDLADGTVPAFATAAARDTAFTNWKNAGNTAFSGMQAFTQSDGRFWRYDTGSTSWLYNGGNPPPIVACTISGGWTAIVGFQPGVYKDSSGLVHIVGGVFPNTTYAPNDGTDHTAVTLPAGYRPSVSTPIMVSMPANLPPVTGAIETTGALHFAGSAAASITANTNHFLVSIIPFHPGWNGSVPLP